MRRSDFKRVQFEPGELHELMYGDARRVKRLRVQAEGDIAARRLRTVFMRPAEIVVEWLAKRMNRAKR